jgi:cell division protein FtsW
LRIQGRDPDYTLIATVALLLGIGIVMVFTSSVVMAMEDFKNPYHFLQRQAIWSALGLAAMIVIMHIPVHLWARYSRPLLLLTLVLLVLVIIPGVGRNVNGATRWLGAGPLAIQPSEFAKFALIIFLADYLARNVRRVESFFRGLLPPLLMLGIIAGLIMLEPDLGTTLTIGGTAFVILFAAGARLSHLGCIGLAGIGAVTALAVSAPYRLRRLVSFLDPFGDAQNSGYQVVQALLAFGSGGLFGVGLGRSRQKFFYLPERHTDMIFAILGEELGFIGAATVLTLFLVFAWRGYRIAALAQDRFASLLAVGITTLITLQALMNIAVATASIPATGIPLPFLSYGGSSLLITLMGVGILLGVARQRTR